MPSSSEPVASHEEKLRTRVSGVPTAQAASSALERVTHVVDHPSFNRFVATISVLRAPDGCPWDREQTHESIAHNLIEEAYEAVDAIESGDVDHLREELGDVLLQVVLQSQIAADAGEFTIDDVCRDVNAKMIRRHPHVFGDAQAESAHEVLDLWDQVKLVEKEGADRVASAEGQTRAGLLDGVPTSFPALMQAQKVSRKAAAVGFEWDSVDDVWDQVREEIEEARAAYACAPKTDKGTLIVDADIDLSATDGERGGSAAAVEMEIGDVLFAFVNVARKMGVDAESALRASCTKFRDRWSFMEGVAWGQGCRIEDLSLEDMEALWAQAKQTEAQREHASGSKEQQR